MKIDSGRFRKAREDSGISRRNLAWHMGVSQQRVWQIETEESVNLNPVIVEVVCDLFKCSPEWLSHNEKGE